MIIDTLAQAGRYTGLSPHFAAAFEFLRKRSVTTPAGRCDIDGDNCFALVQSYTTRPVEQALFEAHCQYADIQFIQAGRETILWSPLGALNVVTQPYVAERDVVFFASPPQWTPLHLAAAQFTIFFPEDGHAPGLEYNGLAEVSKVVIKVRI